MFHRGGKGWSRSFVGTAVLAGLVTLLVLPGGFADARAGAEPPLAPTPSLAPVAVGSCGLVPCASLAVPLPQLAAETWYNVTAAQRFSPPPLTGASMTFDARDNYLVLFGGCSSSACPSSAETWTYSGGSWTNVTQLGPQPPARAFASLAYDSHDGYAVLFGGRNASGVALNDTWEFSAGIWTNVTNVTDAPPARYAASMIFDQFFVVLFGGCGTPVCPRNDTWRFITGVWTNVSSLAGAAPAARYAASFSWDAGDGYGVLFGGCGVSCPKADSWSWSKGRWTALNTTLAPPAREFASMTYDVTQNLTYLFGGVSASGLRPDTWKFANSRWTNVTAISGAGPTARFGMASPDSTVTSSSSGSKRWAYSLFYGGSSNATCLTCGNDSHSDSWIFEPALAATASALPTVVELGQPVSFSALAGGGSSPYVYLWQFGDGASVFGQKPSHAYKWAHGFSAVITASDTAGVSVTTTVLVTVVNGPVVTASVQPTATDTGRSVTFLGGVTGGTAPYTYRWSFGDLAASTSLDATHSYNVPGLFPVNLSATDTVQGYGVAFGNVSINPLPAITATASNMTPAVGTNVTFSSTVSGGTAPFGYAWKFGDGNVSASASGIHRYGASGTFLVLASVTDAAGAMSWRNFSVVVSDGAPIHHSSTPSGTDWNELVGAALLVGAAIVAIAGVVLVVLHRRRREPPSLAAAPVGQADWDGDGESDNPSNSRTARRSINRFYRRRG